MSEPIFVLNKKIIDTFTMTVDTSVVLDISDVYGFCVHEIWTGTPTGNIIVSASNDGINFVALDTHAAGGASGQNLYNVNGAHYRYVQVSYTFSGSTGILNVYFSGKR